MSWLIPAVIVLAFAWFLASLRRANELARFTIRSGEVTGATGHIPARLLADVRDVVRRPAVERGVVRLVVERGALRVLSSGAISAGQAQRLRNVVGLHKIEQLRGAPRRR